MSRFIQAVIFLSIYLPSLAIAHNKALEPCGTVVKSIKLQRDCFAPMVIGADNITVDLNGHTIQNVPPDGDQSRAGVEIMNRRGVTVKNGTIVGPRNGLFVYYGSEHTFKNLKVRAEGEWVTPQDKWATAVSIQEVDHIVLKRISTTPGLTLPVFIFIGAKSKISQVKSRGSYIFGDDLIIFDNKLDGGLVGAQTSCGLSLSGNRNVLWNNKLTCPSTNRLFGGLCVEGSDNLIKHNLISGTATGLDLAYTANNNLIRNNKITSNPGTVPDALDIRCGDNACSNTWRNNKFKTDSEGDGPAAGCIR